MAGIARFSVAALDCPDPYALAAFYSALTGWPLRSPSGEGEGEGEGEWVELVSDTGATLAFQRAPDHQPPTWPSAEHPQQGHLDFDVPDLAAGEEQVLALGARKADHQPDPDQWLVFLDPAGHPFCLVRED